MRSRAGMRPRRPVAAGEQARRVVLAAGIACLTLLGIGPVFGHHLMPESAMRFAGTDHVGELCIVALREVLATVHEMFHIALVAGLVYAAWERVMAMRRLRRVLASLDATPPRPGDAWWSAAQSAGVDPRILRIADGLANPAFTVGWFAPRIYVARSLAGRLPPSELAAVLAHEGAHVSRRDPLRLSALRFCACAVFWIPALRRLADDVADEVEIQADDLAARAEPLVLASAILAVAALGQRSPPLPATVGFARSDLVERRVRRLVGERTPAGTHLTRWSLWAAGLAIVMAWSSGIAMSQPLSPTTGNLAPASGTVNCIDHRGPAILHLFCGGLSFGSMHHRCPHPDM